MAKQRVTTAGICLSFLISNAKKSAGKLKKKNLETEKVECLTLN